MVAAAMRRTWLPRPFYLLALASAGQRSFGPAPPGFQISRTIAACRVRCAGDTGRGPPIPCHPKGAEQRKSQGVSKPVLEGRNIDFEPEVGKTRLRLLTHCQRKRKIMGIVSKAPQTIQTSTSLWDHHGRPAVSYLLSLVRNESLPPLSFRMQRMACLPPVETRRALAFSATQAGASFICGREMAR